MGLFELKVNVLRYPDSVLASMNSGRKGSVWLWLGIMAIGPGALQDAGMRAAGGEARTQGCVRSQEGGVNKNLTGMERKG